MESRIKVLWEERNVYFKITCLEIEDRQYLVYDNLKGSVSMIEKEQRIGYGSCME